MCVVIGDCLTFPKPNEERFIRGAQPCGYNVVALRRVGPDARFPLWMVKEDWGWVKSRPGKPQGPQRRTPGSPALGQQACVPVAAGRSRSPGSVGTQVPYGSRGSASRRQSQAGPGEPSWLMTHPKPAVAPGALVSVAEPQEGGAAAGHGHRADSGGGRFRATATARRAPSSGEGWGAQGGGAGLGPGGAPALCRGWPARR
jgi:hypothetical protein